MSDCLCKELIDEIFTRLPVVSLLRFRSLSKFLCSYIATPDFIRMYTLQSPQKLLIRHRQYDKDGYGDKDFCTLHVEDQLPLCSKRIYIGLTRVKIPFRKDFRIGGSCNGILCLFDLKSISLWNPSIKRKLNLPECSLRCIYGEEIGFGFNPITESYKIVCIPNLIHGRIVDSSFVYDMKTRAWCAIASPTPFYTNVYSNACCLDGALHWVVGCNHDGQYDVHYRYILALDLSTHVFGMIELPEPRMMIRQLTTIQGSLVAISMHYDYIWIWVRRDASWILVFNSRRNKIQGGLGRVYQITSNGDLLIKTWLGEAHSYNPKIGEQSRLVNFNSASHICDMEMCVESLELLDLEMCVAFESNCGV